MRPIGTAIAQVLNRNSLAREIPRDPEGRRTWLAENASVLAESGCPLCGGELPPEAIREHLCCRCEDSGWFRTPLAEDAFGRLSASVEPCTCRLTGVPEQEFIRRSGIPATMATYSLDSWGGSTRFLNAAREFITTWPPAKPVMFLTGTVGSGKSGLAIGVLRELWLRHHRVGRFVVAPELIRRFQATFDEEAFESKEDIHNEMEAAALIVLDDYGTEKNTEFAAAEMFRLINTRHSQGRPLIVTTNLDVLSLDPRIKSRLSDRERSVWMQFTGPDRREM